MQKVSVVSNSLIIIELLKLVFKKRAETLEYFKSDETPDLSAKVFFVDDSLPNFEQVAKKLHENGKTLVVLGEDSELPFAPLYTIAKPFLPNDIELVMERIEQEQKGEEEIKTQILDADEIAHIKALMDLEESEDEEPVSAMELLERKESLHLKKYEAKEFLYELCKLTPKELKKLLKKAKVSLKIRFKKSDDA